MPYHAEPDDIAFIQFSSGSTGSPKGVVLTHRNLLTNVMAIIEAAALSENDTTLSWMPLTHDMGLIGFHLTPLIGSMRQCIMPVDLFVRNPARWLQSLSVYKATVSSSPNFGYKHLLRQLNGNRQEGIDLSTVRLIMNGAEPISMELCREFLDAMAPYGLKQETMYTVYGLAEATLAVTFPVPGQAASGVRVSRKCLGAGQHVLVDASADHVEFANLGKPVSHCCVRIANEKGAELQEGLIGYVHVKGGGVTSGYYNNEAATKQVLKNGWLNTQDLGFVLNGHLYVTGRAKDVIFSGGLNFYAHDVERIAEAIDEIETGKIVACGIPDAETQTDALVLFVLYRKSLEDFYELSQSLKALIAAHLGIQPRYVVPVKNIPKTTSGKLKRFQLAEHFKDGQYNELLSALENIHREKMQLLLPALVQPQTYTAAAIEQWLRAYLAAQLQLQPESIDPQRSFAELGLSSMMAVALAEQLEKLLQRKIDATVAWDFANIQALSVFLANDTMAVNQEKGTAARAAVQNEAIAVIGMGCRFPGAKGIAAYWELLQNGQSAISQLPANRKEWWPGADKDANTWAGYLDEVSTFDAQFFGISSKEAVYMDPQQRILMEVCWEALEQAGITDDALSGAAAGVFIGLSSNDYARMQFGNPGSLGAYTGTGSAFSIAANRLSYFLDIKGPSMAIDTACSSSLVAVYEACNSLRRNDCNLAIAGGVNLILGPELHAVFGAANMLAPDGKCKTFDEKADGYVRGEGCGVVILKRLSDAVDAGDNILAVIRGAAVNQDGRSNGLTAPNGMAQQAVIRKALQDAGVQPAEISYVEAHGTGTSLGDPIEMNALKTVLTEGRSDAQLWVGAVKTNIGHLEAAAGIAGLIKTVLMMQHGEIPPHLHFQSLNPKILLDGSPVRIPLERTAWTMPDGKKRLAGVSSFGFGGTNSHVV
ncbi:MAG TPA: beta-ketoacyl synthase N-terminal-like domain-containing protein, partial [Chitinophaga sp.]